jgi:pimeloyl-ACP methyl ester carboxylesterase
MPFTFVALHGFASSPSSRKNVHFDALFRARGIPLLRPDLNQPSFGALSVGAMQREIERTWEAAGRLPLRLIGSSLGGYMAALFASVHPARVDRALLLCPAFDLVDLWPQLISEAQMSDWRTRGALAFEDATKQLVDVHYALFEEGKRTPPFPRVSCPTIIVHGRQDARVPFAQSERYVRETPAVQELVAVDDGHDLLASLAVIDSIIDRFLLEGVTSGPRGETE